MKVEPRFRASIVNTHPSLHYQVTAVRELKPPAAIVEGYERFLTNLPSDCTPLELQRRDVFHTCSTTTVLPFQVS